MKLFAPISIVIALGLMTAGCSDSGNVSKAIGALVREQKVKELRLASVTNFQWDKVYLFGPYTPRPEVCKTLGVQATDCERVVPYESTDDGEMTLAFMSGARIARFEMHARRNGDFTPVPASQPIPSAAAVFRVVPSGTAADGTTWLTLVLK